MNLKTRLDLLWQSPPIYLKTKDPVVVFSDYHMNNQGKADYFYPNYRRYLELARHYADEGWTIIVPGDMEDMWKYPNVKIIRDRYKELYDLHNQLLSWGRFFRITGNHDIQLGYPEALVLDHPVGKFFFVHGYQGDLFNDMLWPFCMMFVRYIAKPLEKLGIKDPWSVSRNPKRHKKVRDALIYWANHADPSMAGMIVGHTHTQEQVGRYYNVGCEMHNQLEFIEINQTIQLKTW
jgi:UDP-2,3-diacylglucosamine pyrophosphatase LpxH